MFVELFALLNLLHAPSDYAFPRSLFLTSSALSALPQHHKSMHAFAERDCAPWDGPAFAIWIPAQHVGGPVNAWIYLRIWRRPEDSLSRFSFPDKTMRIGSVMYFQGLKSPQSLKWSTQPRQQLSGTVHFSRVGPHQSILGELDFRTDQNASLRGRFEAQWRQGRTTC